MEHGLRLRICLMILLAMSFSGVFCKVFFFDGSSVAKFAAKQSELVRVNEREVFDHTASVLFGGEQWKPETMGKLLPAASADVGREKTEQLFWYDKLVVLLGLFCVWLMIFPPIHRVQWLSYTYLLIAAYLIALAVFRGINGGAAFSELALLASATRWGACIALFLWLFCKPEKQASIAKVKWVLIVATAMTFLAHGYEAFCQHPKFKDLLFGGAEFLGFELSGQEVKILLKCIGIMDLCLAFGILFWRHYTILLWMAFWGGITAFSRPVALGGGEMWIETLLRTTNFGVPFVLFVLGYVQHRKTGLSSA